MRQGCGEDLLHEKTRVPVTQRVVLETPVVAGLSNTRPILEYDETRWLVGVILCGHVILVIAYGAGKNLAGPLMLSYCTLRNARPALGIRTQPLYSSAAYRAEGG